MSTEVDELVRSYVEDPAKAQRVIDMLNGPASKIAKFTVVMCAFDVGPRRAAYLIRQLDL